MDTSSPVIVVNFSHPLGPDQLAELEALTGAAVEVHSVFVHLDLDAPLEPQIQACIDAVPLTADEWQAVPLVVVLPGIAIAAAMVLAEVHGLRGHFPTCITATLVDEIIPRFAMRELVGLERIRNHARQRRALRR